MKKFLAIALTLLICSVVFAAGYEVFGSVVPYAVYDPKGDELPTKYAGGVVFGFDKYNDNGVYYGLKIDGMYASKDLGSNDFISIIPEFMLGKTVYVKNNFSLSIEGGAGAEFNYPKDDSNLFEVLTEKPEKSGFVLSGTLEAEYDFSESVSFAAGVTASFIFGANNAVIGGLAANLGFNYYI